MVNGNRWGAVTSLFREYDGPFGLILQSGEIRMAGSRYKPSGQTFAEKGLGPSPGPGVAEETTRGSLGAMSAASRLSEQRGRGEGGPLARVSEVAATEMWTNIAYHKLANQFLQMK